MKIKTLENFNIDEMKIDLKMITKKILEECHFTGNNLKVSIFNENFFNSNQMSTLIIVQAIYLILKDY